MTVWKSVTLAHLGFVKETRVDDVERSTPFATDERNHVYSFYRRTCGLDMA